MAVKPSSSGQKHDSNTAKKTNSSGYSLSKLLVIAVPIILLFFFIGVFVGSQIMHTMDEPSNSLGIYHSSSLVTNKAGRGDDAQVIAPAPVPQTALRGAVTSLQKAASLTQSPLPTAVTNQGGTPVMALRRSPPAPVLVKSGGGILTSDSVAAAAANAISNNNPAPQVSVAAVSAATVVRDKTAALQASLHVTSAADSFRGPTNLDIDTSEAGVLISAYIYLEDSPFDGDMRTIFSNKAPGCDKSPSAYGLSLFVNAWQTRDRQLYTEYGNEESGCNKFGTEGVQLQLETWYHVAVLHTATEVAIYLNGVVVASTSILQPHLPQINNPLIIGQFIGGSFPFYGNISHVSVVHLTGGNADKTAVELVSVVNQLSNIGNLENVKATPGLIALITLKEATARRPGSKGEIYRPLGGTISSDSGIFSFDTPVGSGGLGTSIGTDGMSVLSSGGLVTGLTDREITPELIAASDALGNQRKEVVKSAMQHAWRYYKQYAWGFDELKPLSHRGHNNWGGMGVTLVDSLDTLWIMGMRQEFQEAKDWVKDKLSFDNAGSVSVFETTIRELGGLLAAYDYSGDDVFLKKAEILGGRLAGAFSTGSGIARSSVNMKTGQGGNSWSGGSAILAELGTLQVEFRYLAHHTKNPALEAKCMRGIQLMNKKQPANGLFPIKISIENGNFADNTITFGALGDSFYEYLLKLWLQGNREETWLRTMYDKSMDGAIKVLLQKSSPSGLSYLSDWNGRSNVPKMDHLVCFMPGILALGAYTDPLGGPDSDNPRAKRDLDVAKALMYTCYQMYARQNSGIAPEYVEFRPGKDIVIGSTAPFYILRPETAESLFVLSQLTKDPIYRDWSFEIFTSINKHCKTSYGYGALRNVAQPNAGVDDRMESFFLAETLKYLYMAQDPESAKYANLMEIVFNTEAHPLKNLKGHKPISQ